MQNFFSQWKMLRYVICALIAMWGFLIVFIREDASRGRILLMIATIGVFSTIIFDMVDKHLGDKKR